MVRDQLVWGIYDKKLRARLLREKNRTLETTVEFCKAAEVAALQNRTLENLLAAKRTCTGLTEHWELRREMQIVDGAATAERFISQDVQRGARLALYARGRITSPHAARTPVFMKLALHTPAMHNSNKQQTTRRKTSIF